PSNSRCATSDVPTMPTMPHTYSAAFRVIRSRKRFAQPAMPFCSLRSSASLSGSTSRLMTDPAPMIALSPAGTGATRAVLVRLNRHVAAEPGVKSEPDAFGIDQSRAILQGLLAAAALPFELEVGELGPAVHARSLVRIALDHDRLAPLRRGDVDDVGQIKFSGGIVVAD